MSSVFQRLSLKDKPFSIFASASDHEIEGFFSGLCDVDPDLTQADRSKACLSQRAAIAATSGSVWY